MQELNVSEVEVVAGGIVPSPSVQLPPGAYWDEDGYAWDQYGLPLL